MSHRHAPKLLAYLLAVPIFALVYAAAFTTRLAPALRPALTRLLGISVIGSTYAGEGVRRAPAKPIRAVAALSFAAVLMAPAVSQPPVAAASEPQQAVVDLAMKYVGYPYVF
ncbi:MAG: hypothetical protein QFC55_06960, partial [Chloroflexota bacterium]|nr:hypothetical protein [Chloroflexota bacterium]